MESELPEFPDEEEPAPSKRKRAKTVKGEDPSAEYLQTLAESEQHAIDQFDKTVLALTGGAFAISFAFLKEVVKESQLHCKNWLVMAWVCWCAALLATLTSFYFSHLAMRQAQRQFHAGIRDESQLGGIWQKCIAWINPSAALGFVFGLISMSIFVTNNLADEHEIQRSGTALTPTNATVAAPSTNAPSTAPGTNTASKHGAG